MSPRELAVLMNGRTLGALTQDRYGRLRLIYDESYTADPSATPLSTSLPLAGISYSGRVLQAFLQGLLPDSKDVLDRWASRFKVSAESPFGLLAHVGEDCAGAVQFVRPERLDDLGPGGVKWLEEAELGDRVAQLRLDPTTWLDADREGQFSLAGAQAKFALLHDGGRWGEPFGAVPTTHIIKPSVGRFVDQDLNEHLCLAAAARAGLVVAHSQIVSFSGERAVAVERYDRLRFGDTWRRVHQEDCCQALGEPPSQKYETDGGPGARRIAGLLRRLLPGDEGDRAVADFVDALAFNWLAGGTDAHAKNFSVLLAGPQVRLAPLYDLASAMPYVAGLRESKVPGQIRGNLKLAMRIGDNREMGRISGYDWESFARSISVAPDALLSRVAELTELVPNAFAVAVTEDAAGFSSSLPDRLVEQVVSNAARCRSALAGRPARRHPGRSG